MSKYVAVEKYEAEQKHSEEHYNTVSKLLDSCIKRNEEGDEIINTVRENKVFLSKRLNAKSKCAYGAFRDVADKDYTTAEDGKAECLKKCSKSACDDFYEYFKRNED